jgi:hypothetical protein
MNRYLFADEITLVGSSFGFLTPPFESRSVFLLCTFSGGADDRQHHHAGDEWEAITLREMSNLYSLDISMAGS